MGASNFGALLAGVGRLGCSSATPNEMMSTILDTSFLTFSGRELGRSLPVSLRLHRYMASANSGKRSWPDLVVSDRVLAHVSYELLIISVLVPDMRQGISGQLRPHKQVACLVSRQGLRIPHSRLEELLKLGLVLRRYERQPNVRNLARFRWRRRGQRLRRAAAKRVGYLRRGHARGLRHLRGSRRWRAGLEGDLLRGLLLVRLALLAREAKACLLRLLLRWWLLPEALRLSRKACKLLLQRRLSKARRLRPQSALEAPGLLERLLLLLAILRLSGSGAVGAP